MSVKWEEPPTGPSLPPAAPLPGSLDLGWVRYHGYRDGYLRAFGGGGGAAPLTWPPLPVGGPIQLAYRSAFRSGYAAGTADGEACKGKEGK